MLVVFSSETFIPYEMGILHQLFDVGLSCFHLRKPHFSQEDYIDYIKKIQPEFHNRIVLHQYHCLVEEFSLKGIHLKEQFRLNLKERLSDYISFYQKKRFSVSTGFHSLSDLEKSKEEYDYQFLSPVFDSISKQGYQGKKFDVRQIQKRVLGLGGVSEDKLPLLKLKGFEGAAFLGAIWMSKQPVEAFLKLQNCMKYK